MTLPRITDADLRYLERFEEDGAPVEATARLLKLQRLHLMESVLFEGKLWAATTIAGIAVVRLARRLKKGT